MKRLLVIFLILSAVGGYLSILGWSGFTFAAYLHKPGELHLDSQKPIQAPLGSSLDLSLRGDGFSRNARLSMFMDVANTDALVGSFPLEGYVHDLQLDGDVLLAASDGEGLQVIDVSNPLRPKLQKSLLRTVPIMDIEQSGSKLYLSCGKQGMQILEIEPGHRFKKLARAYWPGTFLESKVHDGYLFVAAGEAGLLVYDLNSALGEGPISQTVLNGHVLGIDYYRNYIYLQTISEVLIYDVSQPRAPIFTGKLPSRGRVKDIAIHDGYMFATDTSGKLSRYLLTDPGKPHLQESLSFANALGRIKITGNSLLIENGLDSLLALDIDKFSTGEQPGYIELEGLSALAEVDNLLYVATFGKGLNIVRKKAILPRQLVAEIPTPGRANDLLVADHWLFVADSKRGLLLKNLETGVEIVPALSQGYVQGLKKSGNYLYLAEGKGGLGIVDITDPSHPVQDSHFLNMQAQTLDVDGNHLVFGNNERLALVDLSDKIHPQLLDEKRLNVSDVVLSSGIAYVAAGQLGLQIYQVEQGKLKHLSSVVPPWPMSQFAMAQKLNVINGLAYIANGDAGLQLIDVRNPRRPQIISSIALPGFAYGIKVAGDRVYASSRFGGLQVVDISQPKRPVLLAHIPLQGLTEGIQPVRDMLYLADGIKGVLVVPDPLELTEIDYLSNQKIKVRLPSPGVAGRYSLQINNRRESKTLNGVVTYR